MSEGAQGSTPPPAGHPLPHSVSFAARLTRLIEAARPPGAKPFTDKQIADGITAAGVSISPTGVSYLRRGTRDNPTKRTIEAIAQFFQVPPSYFFDDQMADRIDAELELITAMNDADVRSVALRAWTLSPEMRRWLAQTLTALETAQRGTDSDSSTGPEHQDQDGSSGSAPD